MKTNTAIAVIVVLLAMPSQSYAQTNKQDFDPEFLKPENVQKMLDVAISEGEKHLGEISVLYHQYMDSFSGYAEKQIAQFKQFFSDEEGQANQGYIPVKNVD